MGHSVLAQLASRKVKTIFLKYVENDILFLYFKNVLKHVIFMFKIQSWQYLFRIFEILFKRILPITAVRRSTGL